MNNSATGIFSILRQHFCWAMAFACLCAQPALAAHDGDLRDINFEIEAGALARALKSFSKQTGVSVIFDNRIVGNRYAPALDGAYDAEEALSLLLADASLTFKKINEHTWAIIHDPNADRSVEKITPPDDRVVEKSGLRDEIIVTANYRPPNHQLGARALYTLDGEQLRLNGALNIAEPIFELPATVASISSANTALLISSGGLNLADLRGLGPERTLVLVNGRRYIRTSGGNGNILGVDLNSIPAPFVDRIEIVNQGAGATIGMEAVAGAVNIVTREDIDGIALTADGGISELGDAAEYSVSALAGTHFDDERGRFAVGLTYASEPSLLIQQRERISAPYGFAPDDSFAPGFGGSHFTPNGRLSGVVTDDGSVRFFSSDERLAFSPDGQSFEPFEGRLDQLYNWTTDFAALPEIERIIGYATGGYEFAPSHFLYAEFHAAQVNVDTQIASSPVALTRGRNPLYGDGILVAADNPFAPPGLLSAAESAAGEPVSAFLLDRRFIELGPRRRDINRRTFQAVLGAEGVFGGDWRYDVSYQFGNNRTRDVARGIADGGRLSIALDSSACAAASGCAPINIFGSTSITPAQADFIRAAPRERVIKTREQIAQAKISGPVYSHNGMDAYVTLGVEHRREKFDDNPKFSSAMDQALGEFMLPGSTGEIALTEPFVTANLPLIVDAPMARFFEIGGAYRYTARHDGGGGFSNVSGNARWSPADGVEIYAHVFHGGRAPNVMELFSAGPNFNSLFFDPCDTGAGALDMVVADNCASSGPLGVGPGFTQENMLTIYESGGNPMLDEERVNSRLFGASVDVHAVADWTPGILTISADWRDHRVKKAIGDFSPILALNDCYNSEGLSSFFCGVNPATGNPFIERDPVTGQVVKLEAANLNKSMLRTSGLDARLQYLAEFDGVPLADTFALDVLYTYTHRVRSEGVFDVDEKIKEGLIDFPKHQIHATASLGTEDLKTVWTVRSRGSAVSSFDFADPAFRAPAVTYVDISVQWRLNPTTIFYGGVENLFDRDIPIVALAPNGFFFEHYDPIGRRFFAGVKAEF